MKNIVDVINLKKGGDVILYIVYCSDQFTFSYQNIIYFNYSANKHVS